MTWLWWGLGALVTFAVIEVFALVTRRIPTLSASVWRATKRWPLLPLFVGAAGALLAVHLWGNGWCPS